MLAMFLGGKKAVNLHLPLVSQLVFFRLYRAMAELTLNNASAQSTN
jgi:hypothetical protein